MADDYGLSGLKPDEMLVDHFSKEFIKKQKVGPGNERSLPELRLEVEGTEMTLSLGTSVTISIQPLADGYGFHSTIHKLSENIFDQIVSHVKNIVNKAELDLLDIGEVCPLVL